MSRPLSLSAARARRIALAAQGFGAERPGGLLNAGHVKRAVDRLGLLQIDSVNVLTRAHYLPLFSRLGNYASDHLDRVAWGRKSQRGLFEFWAHEASLLPLAAHPLFRWRMQRARENAGDGKGKLHLFRREKAKYIDEVLREIADRGPLAASELSNGGERRGAWWGWNDGKLAVEWLFFAGLRHHGDAARHLRAGLRPHRARAAGGRARPAHAVGRGGAARALAPVGRGAGRRHRIRPARLLSPRRRRHQGAARRAGRGGRSRCRSTSRAGTGRPISIPPRASRARSRRAPCWRRSIR